jgi:hypothetical protein
MLLDEQKRQLTLALQPVEPVEQGVDYNRGQAFERLVHQQQCRIAHQGTPDHHWNLAAVLDFFHFQQPGWK